VRESSRIKVYNALAIPIFAMWKGNMHPQTEGLKWVTAFVMKFFRRTVG